MRHEHWHWQAAVHGSSGRAPRGTTHSQRSAQCCLPQITTVLRMLTTLLLLVAACYSSAAAAERKISTWVRPGGGGPMGDDLTESLAWVKQHKDHISSLSIIGMGPPGKDNVTSLQFCTELQAMGIDTYFLWGGNWNSFSTPAAINGSVEYVLKNLNGSGLTGVDLDFEHPETWGPDFADPLNASFAAELTSRYSDFLRTLSAALHANGKKMSECVGSYPTRDGGVKVYYDPAVVAATNDVVRVMNYDMYYVGGRGNAAIAARPDCAGMGPTSTTPWAEMSMQWWAARVPKEKLVMGLPAYSNDYSALPGWGGGNGTQAGVGPPTSAEDMCNATLTPNATQKACSNVEAIWDFFSQIYTYMYTDVQGHPRMRYGTEVESTRSQLRTASKLGITQVGFWSFNSCDKEMGKATIDWVTGGGEGGEE